MLLAIPYHPKVTTEEAEKRSLAIFTNWTPPEGFEFKAHYALASGGGIAIVEASSSAAVVEALAPWGPYLEFHPEPCADIAEGVAATQRAFAWRDSLK